MSDWECPKCKTEYDASGPYDEDSGEHTCDECGFRFDVEIEYDPSYTVTCVDHEWLPPAEYSGMRAVLCKHCGAINHKWMMENR